MVLEILEYMVFIVVKFIVNTGIKIIGIFGEVNLEIRVKSGFFLRRFICFLFLLNVVRG